MPPRSPSRVTRANFERYNRVLKKRPGERTLAECMVLDEWAQTIPLLTHLAEDARLDICQSARMSNYQKGQPIVPRLSRADKLHIIFSGQVSITVFNARRGTERVIGTLGRSESFGEVAMLKGEKRHTMSYSAIQPAVLFTIDAQCFDRTLRPTYGVMLRGWAEFYKSVAPFRNWAVEELLDLAKHTRARTVGLGHTVCDAAQQSEETALVYFVVKGVVRMSGFPENTARPEAATQLGEAEEGLRSTLVVRSDGGGGEPGGGGVERVVQLGPRQYFGLANARIFAVDEGRLTVAHSSEVQVLAVPIKKFVEVVDRQTLRHFGAVVSFRSSRSKRVPRQSADSRSAVSFLDELSQPDLLDFGNEYDDVAGDTDDLDGDGASPSPSPRRGSADGRGLALQVEAGLKYPSTWLPLKVSETPRPSRAWIRDAEAAAAAALEAAKGGGGGAELELSHGHGVAAHLDELVMLFDSNESLLSCLAAGVCIEILHSLGRVNQLLDEVGWWEGHASAR
eukprot:SAG11_NODE_4294_length_1966_cov_1.256026_1_plen_508_part_01